MTIEIIPRIGTSFGDSIAEIFRVLSITNNHLQFDNEIVYDLSKCEFSNPFLLAGLHLIASGLRKRGCKIDFIIKSNNAYKSYTETVKFPEALFTESIPEDIFKTLMESFLNKTYIPIVSFPTGKIYRDANARDRTFSVLNAAIRKQCKLPVNMFTAVSYLIDEAVNNILDHSQDERGVVFAQCYPRGSYLDICIGDSGIGILGSYKANKYDDILTNEVAISKAVNGLSTKDLPDSRGFGISTSKNMLVRGLRGKYFLLSGNAAYIDTVSRTEIITLPDGIQYDGTILFMRVPLIVSSSFNYMEFVDSSK